MKKPVVRTCIACRQEKEKKQMLRIVRDKDGNIKLDFTGKASGRGAYSATIPPVSKNASGINLSAGR